MNIIKFNDYLLESKKTESETLNILYNKESLPDLIKIDKSTNQILLPAMAYFLNKGSDLKSLDQIFSKIPELLNNKNITIQYTKQGIKINNDLFTDWIKFSEKIDAIYSALEYKKRNKLNIKTEEDINEMDTPIWEGNGIKIYDATDVGKCIRLGKGQSFCISQPANTMYQSYRDTKVSTFYFIFDSNQKNALKTVVFDNTQYGVELTDETNNTGTISKYGTDVEGYIEYLKSKGVPIELLVNKQHNEEEKKENELIGEDNDDLKWFIDLSPELKSKYIGRGHELSNDQFNYLVDNKLYDLLNQYINIGHHLHEKEFNKIEKNPNILKTYIRSCYQKLISSKHYDPNIKIIKYLYNFGYFNNNKIYLNGYDDEYYKNIIHPTKEYIDKDCIDFLGSCKKNYYEVVKFYLENYDISENYKSIGLYYACWVDSYEIVKLLFNNEVDVKLDTIYADELIIISCKNNNYEIVKLLLENGAVADVKHNEPLHIATIRGYYDIVKILVKYGADPKDLQSLRNVCQKGYYDIVKFLLEKGAIDVRDIGLHYAIENDHQDVVNLLKSYKKEEVKESKIILFKNFK